jgi:hypothetical protein
MQAKTRKKHEIIYVDNKSISVYEKNLRFDIVNYIFNYNVNIYFKAQIVFYLSLKK